MFTLNLIEDRFNSLSLKSQIELFLLPFLVLVLIWNLFFNEIALVEDINQKKLDLNSLHMRTNIVDIINDIRVFSLNNKIKIDYLNSKEKTINIKIDETFDKQLLFIKYIENYNSFSNINYLKQEESYLELNVSFERIFLKKKSLSVKEFSSKSENLDKTEDVSEYKLEAIVGEKVFLNNKWLVENQTIDNYKLSRIENSYILLSNGFVKLKIRLHKND